MTIKPVKKTSRKDWHPADIKAALDKKGWTLAGLALHYGLNSSTSFSHTFIRSMPTNERRIADALGIPVQDIWPSRYYADGTPKPRGLRGMRTKGKSTAMNDCCNGNSAQGA